MDRSGQRRVGRTLGSLGAAGLLLGATLTTAAQARYAGHPAAAGQPTYGGTLTEWAGSSNPNCLDPQKTSESVSNAVDQLILDGLLYQDFKGHPSPNLATSYKVSNGGTRITFQLRKGVKFSNGDPFNASAVKYTFDRALDPATKSPVSASQLAGVTGTKVVSPYVVQINLKAPSRPLLQNLEGAYLGILDPKATKSGSSCDRPIGTGIYKIQSTGPAFSTITLAANKNHNWRPSSWIQNKRGVPYVTKLVLRVIASDASAISEMLSGGVDLASVPGTQLARVQGNSKIKLHTFPTQGEDFLEFNTTRAPFNTLAARKAVAEIMDRAAIIKAALAGRGKPVYNAIPPAIPYFDKKAEKLLPHLNTSDAASLIEANHLTGPYDLLVPSGAPFQTIAEIVQASAAQVGMKLNIVTKALPDFIPAAGKGQFDMLLLGYGYPDPDVLYLLLHSSQGGGKGLNFTNYTNPTLDQLLTQGRQSLKTKTAQTAYNKAQELINKEIIFVGLAAPSTVIGLRSNVKGFHVNKLYVYPTQDLYVKTK